MALSSSSSEGNFAGRSFSGRSFGRAPSQFGERVNSTKAKQLQPQHSHISQNASQFDILAWYPKYQSCQRYFVEHAQHDVLVQAFASFINILLPYQRTPPIYTCRGARSAAERMEEISSMKQGSSSDTGAVGVSLIPYIRRLVATGMDAPQILHGFFGNDWQQGVGPQRETERRNYLFSAKSGGWASVKKDYDMLPLETVPFLRPLNAPSDEEVNMAEKTWGEWLAMEDWMVGSRAPEQDPM